MQLNLLAESNLEVKPPTKPLPVEKALSLLYAHTAMFCWSIEGIVDQLEYMYQSIPELFSRR